MSACYIVIGSSKRMIYIVILSHTWYKSHKSHFRRQVRLYGGLNGDPKMAYKAPNIGTLLT